MMGAGILPGPFARADEQGLDDVLEALERAAGRVGRRLRAAADPAPARGPGPARPEVRPGLLPVPAGRGGDDIVKLETRGDVGIVWLNRPPANPLSPELVAKLIETWEQVDGKLRASSSPRRTSSRSARAPTSRRSRRWTRARRGASCVESAHRFMRGDGAVADGHDRGGQLARVRRRLRAGDGVRLPHRRRVGHVRPARDQPRDHPRLRRHPAAAAARGRGEGARDEPRRRPDRRLRRATATGSSTRSCRTTSCSTPRCRGRASSSQQAPLAIEQIKKVSAQPELDEGLEVEGEGFAAVFGSEDAKEGIGAFLGKRQAEVPGQVTRRQRPRPPQAARLAELLGEAERAVVLTGAGISVPSGIPDFRTPGKGLWEKVDPMKVAHIDVFRRAPDEFWHFYGQRFATLARDRARTRAHDVVAELERRGLVRGVITQNIDRLHRAAGSENVIEVHGSIEWCVCRDVRRQGRLRRACARSSRAARRTPECARLHHAAEAERRPVRRDAARGRDGRRHGARRRGRPDALRRLVARGLPGGRRCPGSRSTRAAGSRSSRRARRRTTARPRSSSRATSSPSSSAVLAALP